MMADRDFLNELLQGLKFQFPYLGAYLVGIVLSFVFWRRYPVPCLLVLLACLIKMGAGIAYTILAPFFLPEGNFDLYEIANHVVSFVDAGAYGLIFAAVFVRRTPPERERRHWHDEQEPDEPFVPPARLAEPRDDPRFQGRG